MNLKVEKKDGGLEDFDRNKVRNGILKSGATPEEAENISVQVETWAQVAAINGIIKSGEVRGKVLELLRSINPNAATSFESYKKQPSL